METTSMDWKVRLGTRTYFYNLAQSKGKNLFLIDFTGNITLADIGLSVATPGPTYFEKLELPSDPFDVEQAIKFLKTDDCKDVELLGRSLSVPAQKEAYSKKKRLFTFIVSNDCVIGETILSEIFIIYDESPNLRIMANSYELDMKKVISNYSRLSAKIKEELSDKLNEEDIKREMNRFLAGVRLCHFLSLENPETLLLKRGQKDLLHKYPFLNKDKNAKAFFDMQKGQALPNEIFFDLIYLGNGKHVNLF